jgi:hypothetical protein
MDKIIDSDFHIFADTPEEHSSNMGGGSFSTFEAFKKVPKRQAWEALFALLCFLEKHGLKESADQTKHQKTGIGAYDLALNTFQGHALRVQYQSGKIENAFHDLWFDCSACEVETELDDACCIEEEDGEQTWVCPDCFCAAMGDEE